MEKIVRAFPSKWWLVIKLLPVLLIFVSLKLLIHKTNMEVLTMNPLFGSIIAGTVFLLGFLISGVLSDYKESEKIPAELATSLDTMTDEAIIIHQRKKAPIAKEWLHHVIQLQKMIVDWLYQRIPFPTLMAHLEKSNDLLATMEDSCQPAFISRIKAEQHAIRRTLIRIQVIRDTDFVSSAYAIVDSLTILVIIGLLLMKIEPFYESLFVLGFVAFLLTYMILLIRDLDNPFDYSEHTEAGPGEVTLFPVHEVGERLQEKLKKLN